MITKQMRGDERRAESSRFVHKSSRVESSRVNQNFWRSAKESQFKLVNAKSIIRETNGCILKRTEQLSIFYISCSRDR